MELFVRFKAKGHVSTCGIWVQCRAERQEDLLEPGYTIETALFLSFFLCLTVYGNVRVIFPCIPNQGAVLPTTNEKRDAYTLLTKPIGWIGFSLAQQIPIKSSNDIRITRDRD